MIALADCNNFYCSVERLFQPRFAQRPIVVVGNNDGNVIARSNEVKPYIAMGAPLHQIQHLIRQHGVEVFSANFALYGDLSNRVMHTLSRFAPLQVYSIDEAFLDLQAVPPDALATYAADIRQTVQQHVGIPISIGVATTKTLSKLANDAAKKLPEGVLILSSQSAVDQLLRAAAVEEIWGIGERRGATLRQKFGIQTAYDLQQADVGAMRRALSVVVARTVLELRGISCLPLQEVREPKKEICTSRAFGHLVTVLTELREAVATYTTRASEKLRAQHSTSALITVFAHTNSWREDLPQYSAHCAVPIVPTNDSAALIAAALRGLEVIFRPGYAYHKAGIILTELLPDHLQQGRLFAEEIDPQRQQLTAVIDAINQRWGRDTIRYAVSGSPGQRPWGMHQGKRSPRYTTRWEELPIVQA